MTSKRFKRKLSKNLITTIIAIVGLILSSLMIIFWGHPYGNSSQTFGALGAIISIVTIHTTWFEVPDNVRWHKFKNAFRMFCIIIPVALIVLPLRSWYRDKQLSEHGRFVYGKVLKTFITHKRRSTHYLARIRYNADNRVWVKEIDNSDFHYKEADSLKILCSSEDPEIFKVESVLQRD